MWRSSYQNLDMTSLGMAQCDPWFYDLQDFRLGSVFSLSAGLGGISYLIF